MEHTFKKGDEIVCIDVGTNGYPLTLGNVYTVESCFIENNIEYVEIESNDSGEPCTCWFPKMFKLHI